MRTPPAIELRNLSLIECEVINTAMGEPDFCHTDGFQWMATVELDDCSELAEKADAAEMYDLADQVRTKALDALHDWNNNGRFER